MQLADIRTIRLEAIVSGDQVECRHLLAACCRDGFFYLDYAGRSGVQWQETLQLIKVFYNQDLETKMRYWRGRNKTGYKPLGIDPGVGAATKDGYQSFRILKDELIKRSEVLPPQVLDHGQMFERFVLTAHEIGLEILTALSNELMLSGADRYEERNRLTESSKSAMEYLKYAKQSKEDPEIGHKAHTDLGCLSLLFHAKAGLQVRLQDAGPWEHVQTRPGVAIVNVGDTLQFMSSGRLRSILHRVIPLPQHVAQERFTVGYFMRAENNASFVGRESETMTAGDWHDNKLKAYQSKQE